LIRFADIRDPLGTTQITMVGRRHLRSSDFNMILCRAVDTQSATDWRQEFHGSWPALCGYGTTCRSRSNSKTLLLNISGYLLLDRPITAASNDGVCRWHAAKLWQTRYKIWSYWN